LKKTLGQIDKNINKEYMMVKEQKLDRSSPEVEKMIKVIK